LTTATITMPMLLKDDRGATLTACATRAEQRRTAAELEHDEHEDVGWTPPRPLR